MSPGRQEPVLAARSEEGLQRLEADIHTGAWHRANADLVRADSLHVGYCTVAVDP